MCVCAYDFTCVYIAEFFTSGRYILGAQHLPRVYSAKNSAPPTCICTIRHVCVCVCVYMHVCHTHHSRYNQGSDDKESYLLSANDGSVLIQAFLQRKIVLVSLIARPYSHHSYFAIKGCIALQLLHTARLVGQD